MSTKAGKTTSLTDTFFWESEITFLMLQCHLISFKSAVFLRRRCYKVTSFFDFGFLVIFYGQSLLSSMDLILIFSYLPCSVAFRSHALINLLFSWKTLMSTSRAIETLWVSGFQIQLSCLIFIKGLTPCLQMWSFPAWVGFDEMTDDEYGVGK